MNVAYSWVPGAARGVAGLDPQSVGERIEALRARSADGTIQPAEILAAAEPQTSPLHPFFQWDDTEAARAWRLHQASYLARVVAVRIEGMPDAPPVRAFVRFQTDDGPRLTSALAAVENPDQWAAVEAEALVHLNRWRREYGRLQRFAAVVSAIDGVLLGA